MQQQSSIETLLYEVSTDTIKIISPGILPDFSYPLFPSQRQDTTHQSYETIRPTTNAAPKTPNPLKHPPSPLDPDVPPPVFPVAAAPAPLPVPLALALVSVIDGTTRFPVAFEVGMAPPIDVSAVGEGIGGGVGMLAVSL